MQPSPCRSHVYSTHRHGVYAFEVGGHDRSGLSVDGLEPDHRDHKDAQTPTRVLSHVVYLYTSVSFAAMVQWTRSGCQGRASMTGRGVRTPRCTAEHSFQIDSALFKLRQGHVSKHKSARAVAACAWRVTLCSAWCIVLSVCRTPRHTYYTLAMLFLSSRTVVDGAQGSASHLLRWPSPKRHSNFGVLLKNLNHPKRANYPRIRISELFVAVQSPPLLQSGG